MVTETLIEEIERLNPQFKWNWRKTKRIIKWRAKQLTPNISYAWGCRGHPGLVVSRNWCRDMGHRDLYSADVEIKSLIDGNVESCSIFYCAPLAVSKKEAFEYADYAIRNGEKIASLKFNRIGWESLEAAYNAGERWRGENQTLQEYLGLNDVEMECYVTKIYPA